jgi:hypothetical protein
MPQRFTIFPDPPTAGTTATITLSNANGATFPLGADVTFMDGNGVEISGLGLPLFTAGGQSRSFSIPENAVTLQVTCSQSATLARILNP